MAGGNLPFGFAPSGSLTSYTPTLRERATDWMRKTLFSDDRAGQGRAEKVMDVVSMTPFGFGLDVYDAGREAGMGNYGTAGLMLGMAGMPGPGPKGKPFRFRAYHGSPHDFDKFSMDKIGTGEGAQAYGHGLYFAENEGIARSYRDDLSGHKYKVGNRVISGMNSDMDGGALPHERAAINAFWRFRGDKEGAIENLKKFAKEGDPYAAKAANWLKKVEPQEVPGRMYEVRINADPEAFLDWDKPLSEQPEAVRKAYAKAVAGDDPLLSELLDGSPESLQLTGLFKRSSGAQAYNTFVDKNKEGATQRLREAGIPGIKYLDAGSRGAGDGTRNYVVFDDRLIEIVRKYGIAGASAMLGYNLLDGMDPAQAEELKRIEGNQ